MEGGREGGREDRMEGLFTVHVVAKELKSRLFFNFLDVKENNRIYIIYDFLSRRLFLLLKKVFS